MNQNNNAYSLLNCFSNPTNSVFVLILLTFLIKDKSEKCDLISLNEESSLLTFKALES